MRNRLTDSTREGKTETAVLIDRERETDGGQERGSVIGQTERQMDEWTGGEGERLAEAWTGRKGGTMTDEEREGDRQK